MVDALSPAKRSWNMSRIQGKNTTPELQVRRLLYAMGYRYRLHRKDLPGKPDIVLPRYKAVIFVHGCFWHRHDGCKEASLPKTRTEFWEKKFEQNVARDKKDIETLHSLGWKVMVVWECELKNLVVLEKRLRSFLVM